MNIHLIGTSHKHSPLEVREGLVFTDDELATALADLRAGLACEVVILSTCNRTEIYVVPKDDYFTAEQLCSWLCEWKGVWVPREHFFALSGSAAARHLYQVAAGVDSQVIGDIQIIGQVRDALALAQTHESCGKLLTRLFTSALHAGKRVKSETDLFNGAVSISYVAVELARKIFHPISEKRTLVVGAGSAGELAARNLYDQGVRDITITNRTPERGGELIGKLGFGDWMPLDAMRGRFHEFDIVIVSTAATSYLVSYDDARSASTQRNGNPQLIVDISMPRNVDPRINSLSNIFCKDLNDLMSVVEANVERRRAEIPLAETIIAEELDRFVSWCGLLPVTPVIAGLQHRAAEIARAEIERNRHRFSPKDLEHIEKLVGSVVRKLIALPMGHLLDSTSDHEHVMTKAEYVRVLFNLDEEGSAEPVSGLSADESGSGDNGNGSNGNGSNQQPANGSAHNSHTENGWSMLKEEKS